ncbi:MULTISPECIES: TetR/AcrR family transcriptional regulator [unclassified Marinobacter]|uniref:TetR/AcrR family transcriptional regulator n=1 Tax=unclassified Marinobacter TaxID=83889 RepID=UPI00192648A6|nr:MULTISPECIES: TetR/AcrR family transcriptional regulator [unclassified Marinobacter]MBL3827166.1 TetR/AcrR family transcriptional regulator [Marinobacter sp. MC3]MBL3895609.1 TetR/AcrR family transcriptional regulator [Marinobacter sp. MW3]
MGRRQDLVDTALRLFYEHGIHAIGINQVLQEAGVAKQTLYNHFESKDSLVEAAVEHRDNLFFEWLETRMNSRPAGREALMEMFDAVHDWFNNRVPTLHHFYGCFFINTCGEYSDPEHPVHKRCAAHKTRVFELLKRHALEISTSETEAEELANALFLLKEGAIVKAHVEGDLDAALKAKAIASRMISPH